MFERLNGTTQRAIWSALKATRRGKDSLICLEHILLGLLHGGIVDHVLKEAGIELELLEKELRARIVSSPSKGHRREFPFSREVKSALSYAMREAFQQGEECINEGHMFLGIMKADSEGRIRDVFMRMNVSPARLRKRLLALIANPETYNS